MAGNDTSPKQWMSYVVVVFFIQLVFFALIGTQVSSAQVSGDQKYTNTKCGVTIAFPADWTKDESISNQKFDTLTALATFEPNIPDGYKSTVELEAWDISQFDDKSINGVAEFEKEYILLDPAGVIVESGNIESVDGKPAYRIVYMQPITDSQEVWKIMETYIVSGDMQHTIRFTATDSETYDKYISVVDNIVKSIRVDENKKC